MRKILVSDVLELPVSERILFVEDVWDSIAAMPDAVPLPAWQRKELERRLAVYRKNPRAGSPWPAVKARVRRR
jgi:putative addiction module component (TIGR02574 family)